MKSHAPRSVARLAAALSAAAIAVWCLAGDGQPGFVVVSSNEVPVTWWRFVIVNPWATLRQ